MQIVFKISIEGEHLFNEFVQFDLFSLKICGNLAWLGLVWKMEHILLFEVAIEYAIKLVNLVGNNFAKPFLTSGYDSILENQWAQQQEMKRNRWIVKTLYLIRFQN